jgi:phage shock protein PspC (stress-responsive transcriptional regulator)
MKKTLTVNISGLVFHIDEDAYDKLNNYLNTIRKHFSTDEGCDEIIAGIEGRIAEMFQEKIKASKQVINFDDVKEVIGQLGEPEQIIGEDEPPRSSSTKGAATGAGLGSDPGYYSDRASKRLFRDPDDKYIGGVCGGLGAFFQIDPTWIRVIFLIGLFAGFGVLLYLILWIVIPVARTTAEKLEMRGERVNLSNIEKSIKEDLQDIKRNLQDISEETRDAFKKKNLSSNHHNGFQSFVLAFVSIVGFFFRIIGGIIGIVVVIISVVLLTALISVMFIGPIGINTPVDAWLFSFPHFLNVVLVSNWLIVMATIAFVLAIGIPLILLIFAGLKLIFNFEINARYLGAFMFFLWITGLALFLFVSLNIAGEFTSQRSITEERTVQEYASDTLYLDLSQSVTMYDHFEDHPHGMWGSWDTSRMDETGKIQGIPRLRIRTHEADDTRITITKESRGSSYQMASRKSERIQYNISQNDSLLLLDPFFTFPKDDSWRVQKVYIELMVPSSKTIETSRDLKKWLQ